MKLIIEIHAEGWVHCPMCTHTVPANLDLKESMRVYPQGNAARVVMRPWTSP